MRDSSTSWQRILAEGFTDVAELLAYLKIPMTHGSEAAHHQFKLRVPRKFAALMEPNNPNDPLLLQVLPTVQELVSHQGFVDDPLKEKEANPVKGLIHKYPHRVLVTLTGVCAINCRYCFRRHFPYENNNPGRIGWQRIIDYIANDPSIYEVILSGGDPLMAKNTLLADFIYQLERIKHVRLLRIHSRLPVVLPERIDSGLLALLAEGRLKKIIVLHANHPRELDERVSHACDRLSQAGCFLLNQSVLLAKVNDDAATLAALSHRLFACGVLPYYLHLLDKVAGAAHFDLPFAKAIAIYTALQHHLPGYLLPKLVREEAGKSHKVLIQP